MLALDRI